MARSADPDSSPMRAALLAILAASLCACGIIYKLPTRQGNVIEQRDLDKLQVGMSHQQVQFLLGTPLAASPLKPDRWDYLAYYKNPRGKEFSRTVTLYFDGDKLARMEGEKMPAKEGAEKPDLEAIEKEEQKAKTEAERAKEKTDTGVIIQQKK
jgi:outer membrane protein assembly factor BamE